MRCRRPEAERFLAARAAWMVRRVLWWRCYSVLRGNAVVSLAVVVVEVVESAEVISAVTEGLPWRVVGAEVGKVVVVDVSRKR